MDRWTERFNSDGKKAIAIHDGSDFPDVCFEGEREYDVMNALAEYEVYESFLSSVSYYASGEQFRIYAKVTNSFIAAYFRECDFGESIFLTREDAEKKLEEMKNDKA